MPKVTKKKATKKAAHAPSALPTVPTLAAVSPSDYIFTFYGPPGVGKTTFVHGLGRVLFLSTDRGTRFLTAFRKECGTLEDFRRAIKELKGAAHHYDYVCIDHVDDLTSMIEAEVCNELGIDFLSEAKWGAGWKAFKVGIMEILAPIKAMKLGIIFICHETIREIKHRGLTMDKTMPDMAKTAWKLIIPLSDLVGYLGFKRVRKGDKAVEIRALYTQPEEALYCKDRTRRKKPPNGWEALGNESDPSSKFIASFQGEN